MKVHHLNCGTLYPFGCGEMVCHVLLVETGNGLVLIDTGFGPKDCDDPTRRVGASQYLIRRVLWEHGPKIVEHTPDGDKWRGFAAAKPAWRSTPATAGWCIAATPSSTTVRSTEPHPCRVRSQHSRR